VSVKPNATLEEAVTLMLARNFSQLPVMTTDREVKGVVSWTSIGARQATKITGPDVQTYMDDHQEINISASLFSGIKIILEHNYVLVRSPDRKISGIVTSNDIALQFEEISTPFLLLAEIENNLRSLIRKKLTIADVKRACGEEHLPKEFSGISELTFGNYVRVLEHVDNWAKLGLYLDRVAFCSELSAINTIRNDVMHFDPDPLSEQDLSKLRNVAKMFDLLRSLRAF
jgi:CBS domain